MGMSYFIFMEMFLNNKWVCMNHYKENNEGEILIPVFESGSRSYFGNAFGKIQSISDSSFKYDSLSPEIKGFINGDDCDRGNIPEGLDVCAVSLDKLKKEIPSGKIHENNYYVLKNDIFKYETEGDDICSGISLEEYKELSDEEKKSYQFYEWDDEFGYVYYFRKMLEHAKWILWEYNCAYYNTNINPVRFIAIAC